jgi:glycine/serine hydroxymethyltransferase
MPLIADWMKQAIDARDDGSKLDQLKSEVHSFVQQFPLPSDK